MKDLQSIAPSVAEDEERAGEKLEIELLGNDGREAIKRPPHVGDPRGKEDLGGGAQSVHAKTEAMASSSWAESA